MRTLLVALAAVCLVALNMTASAAEGWQRLGRSAVSLTGVGRVVVVAPNTFRRVMLESNGAAELTNVRIEFADGTAHAVPAALSFTDTEKSRVIDLPGAAKALRGVVFTIRGPGGAAAPQGRTIVLHGGQP